MNQVLLANEQLWWYVARSGGIVALVLSGLAVIWGLLLSTKLLQGRPTPKWLLSLHRFLGALSVTFTGIHVAALVADSYVHFGWSEVFVPLASAWRPIPVALGVVSMYLLVAVQASSMMMKRIPRKWWKGIHMTSYLLFWTGLVHGATTGTDAANPFYVAGTALMSLAVIFLTGFKVIGARKAKAKAKAVPKPKAKVADAPAGEPALVG